MSDIETPDYDIDREQYAENGESLVEIIWPAELVKRVGNEIPEKGSESEKFGYQTEDIAVKGEYRQTRRFGNSLVNFDAYISDDVPAVNGDDVWQDNYETRHTAKPEGFEEAHRMGLPTLNFELYRHELVEAAKQRAIEDRTHHIRVLAEWVYRAFPTGDRIPMRNLGPLTSTLVQEASDNPHVPWVLAWGGDPDEWRFDGPPIGSYGAEDETLAAVNPWEDEVRSYEMGGWEYVTDARIPEDNDES